MSILKTITDRLAGHIHHNTLKKAERHGITLVNDEEVAGRILAQDGEGNQLAYGMNAKDVLEAAIQAQEIANEEGGEGGDISDEEFERVAIEEGEGAVEDEETADEDVGEEGHSIVKPKYRAIYKPFRMTNGDDFAGQLRQFLVVVTDDGKERIDEDKLQRLAEANNVWVGSYASLNVGQRRMTIGNRLRGLVRRGVSINWKI